MWVHLNTSDVHPSRHELHEQFNNPVKSSRRVVTHSVGCSMKSPASVDSAGSGTNNRLSEIKYADEQETQSSVLPTYSGTKNKIEAPAETEKNARVTVV